MLITVAPVLIMVYGSFKGNTALSSLPPDLSFKELSLDNYRFIFDKNVTKSLGNSLIISICTTMVALLLDTMAGYVFARKKFLGKNFFFILLMATMMIPKQILMVPTFILLTKLGMYNTRLAVILSSAAVPFGVFLMKQSMSTLPQEIFEAAEIDGCSNFQQYLKIALPLSKSAIGALSIFLFVQIWNDFMWQLVMLTGKANLTMPLFVSNLIAERSSMFGYQFAGGAIATIPIIIVFLIFRNYFVSGITAGAVKG